MRINSRFVLFIVLLVAVTTLCKFFLGPDLNWSGFSPVIAIGLFSGMLINNKRSSFFLPLAAVLASDVIIHVLYSFGLFPYPGFYTYMIFNYSLLLAVTLLGWALKGKSYGRIALGGVTAPSVFFLISNAGAWLIDTGNLYTNDLNGLIDSYAAGLPFYRNALSATLIFLPLVLIAYNYIVKKTTALKLA